MGFDAALVVQGQEAGHHTPDELHLTLQVAQVEATHGAVGWQQLQSAHAELVPPCARQGHQVALGARQQVGHSCGTRRCGL